MDESSEVVNNLIHSRENGLNFETMCDTFTFRSADKLNQIATELQKSFSINDAKTLHYAYIMWLNNTLKAFIDLMNEETIRNSVYYQRFLEIRPNLTHTSNFLKKELENADDVNQHLSDSQQEVYWNIIGKTAKELTSSWRQLVENSAKQ